MTAEKISMMVEIQAQFNDLDPMNVVWHGNYARFLEHARSALMGKIGYNYAEMANSGYSFPIVDMRVKCVSPITLHQRFKVKATLEEWENRIRVSYVINDADTQKTLSKAQTIQLAVEMKSLETQFVCPNQFLQKVAAFQ